MNWEIIDSEFSGISDVTYLNICSIGPMPMSVMKAQESFMDDRVHPFGKDAFHKGAKLTKATKEELGKLLNCKPSEIGITTTTATGMGEYIGGLDFRDGDNVIISDQEFPSTILGFIPLRQRGVELRTVQPRNGYLDIEDFKNLIDNNTRAIVVSAVQFTNGFFIDLTRLGALCKLYNIHLVVDGIQAVGRLNIDVKKMNISFMSCGGFKGLMSNLGIGFIYCDENIIEDLEPTSASYTNVDYDLNPPTLDYDFENTKWREGCRRFEAGHLNYSSIAGLHQSVKLINSIGIEKIQAHVLGLQNKLLERIGELDLAYMTPETVENYSGIFSIYYPTPLYTKVVKIMNDNNIAITISSNGYIRLGIGLYNKLKDIDALVEALKQVADLKKQ